MSIMFIIILIIQCSYIETVSQSLKSILRFKHLNLKKKNFNIVIFQY